VIVHDDRFYPEQRTVVQVSLALSTYGRDYRGGGTRFRTYDGRRVNLHEDERLAAGDLLLFNQANEHSVDPVTHSVPDDPLSGHWRILMPDHRIAADPNASIETRPGVLVPHAILAAYETPGWRDLFRTVGRVLRRSKDRIARP
jgi:hypothetical protein